MLNKLKEDHAHDIMDKSTNEDSSTTDLESIKISPIIIQKRKSLPKPIEVRINHQDLKQRLDKDLQEEERYNLINDAKLRAMKQGTASYEDFR
jgi:hypothetical protein